MEEISNTEKGKFTKYRSMILAAAPIAFILISGYFYYVGTRYVSTDDAYIKIGISSLSPQINGIVSEVKAKNTQEVKKGEPLLYIDKTPYNINVQAAEAALSSSVNQIKAMKASYHAKFAELQIAQADLLYYQKQYDRVKSLRMNNTSSQAELDEAKRKLDDATQEVNNSEDTIKQHLANLGSDAELPIENHALYLEAKAKLDRANFDLANTTIAAPFDGAVANLYIKEGSFVSIGVPIASVINDHDIWIEANFKETQLTNIKPGQIATIEIDTYPGVELKAQVIGITKAAGSEFSILPAQNSSGNWVKVTQRINVRLELVENQRHLPLSAGMSVVVTVDTKGR